MQCESRRVSQFHMLLQPTNLNTWLAPCGLWTEWGSIPTPFKLHRAPSQSLSHIYRCARKWELVREHPFWDRGDIHRKRKKNEYNILSIEILKFVKEKNSTYTTNPKIFWSLSRNWFCMAPEIIAYCLRPVHEQIRSNWDIDQCLRLGHRK